jgi:hypothetical protein
MKIPNWHTLDYTDKAKVTFIDPSRGGKVFSEVKENVLVENYGLEIYSDSTMYGTVIEIIPFRHLITIEWLQKNETVVEL